MDVFFLACLLIGQHLGEGQTRVIVHGNMQSQEAGMFVLSAQASIAAQANLGERVMPLISRCSMSPGRDAHSAVWEAEGSDRAIGSAGLGAGCG